MGFKMRDLNQQIIRFDHNKNYENEDFFISNSNKHILDFFEQWPKWEKNFLNIVGENFSGKTHIVNIFLKKFKGIKLDASLLNNDNLKELKIYQNIVLENLTNKINEKLLYTLINMIDQNNKFLIITSSKPMVDLNFSLEDLSSRSKSFILQNIEKPDDELIFALLVKNLSDRQISLEKKLIDFIIRRIDRSYSKIFNFIYKIDEISLKKKKSIDLKIIKEVLERD
tara:strand:+ start:893 stop:1570 length:678 start_codon:yes stop_codon:yes gene_type:complete